MSSTFKRILGEGARNVVNQHIADTSIVFAHSVHSLMHQRAAIDAQTAR